jgi:hypothetical protein
LDPGRHGPQRDGPEQANEIRRQRGWSPLTVAGWQQPSFYEPQTNSLTWSIIGMSEGSGRVRAVERRLVAPGNRPLPERGPCGTWAIDVFGDWGFDRGSEQFTLTPRNGGASISVSGKYLWLYRRQPDGSWKQSRVMWKSSDPLPKGGV